jgi:hypothetical protein
MTTKRFIPARGEVILLLLTLLFASATATVGLIILCGGAAESPCQDMAPPIAAASTCEEVGEPVGSQVTPDTATRTIPNLELRAETTVPAEESATPCVSQILGVDAQGQETGLQQGHPPMSVEGPAILSLRVPEDPGTLYVYYLPPGEEFRVTLPGQVWVYPPACAGVALRDMGLHASQLVDAKPHMKVVIGPPMRG